MPVVMLVAALAVLIGVIVVALGRGGELAYFQADYFPLKLEHISATDVALFRPPMALWGYNAQATDEALNRIANALTERDIEISALQQQVADLEETAGQRSRGAAESARNRDVRPPIAAPMSDPTLKRLVPDEVLLSQPSVFGDDRPPGRRLPSSFDVPPSHPSTRREAPPFTRPPRAEQQSRFGLPPEAEEAEADEEDEDG